MMTGFIKIFISSIKSCRIKAPDNLPAEEIIIVFTLSILYSFFKDLIKSTCSFPVII